MHVVCPAGSPPALKAAADNIADAVYVGFRDQDVVPIEVFAFGNLCIMVEGRCQLSSYVAGASPNRHGVCSPAKFVRWDEEPDGVRRVSLNTLELLPWSLDEAWSPELVRLAERRQTTPGPYHRSWH